MNRWQDSDPRGRRAELLTAQVQSTAESNSLCGSSVGQERLEGCAEPSDVQGKAGGQRPGQWRRAHPPGSPTLFLGWGLSPAKGGLPESPVPHQPLRSPATAPAYHPALWKGKCVSPSTLRHQRHLVLLPFFSVYTQTSCSHAHLPQCSGPTYHTPSSRNL